jgi:hypothetical protein
LQQSALTPKADMKAGIDFGRYVPILLQKSVAGFREQ